MSRYGQAADRALDLFVKLARCYNSVAEQTHRDIESHGFQPSEFALLELLYHKGPQPQGEIARQLLLTSGSITHVVDKLVAQGLVRRVSCAKDRRRLYAELTEVGQERIAAVFPHHAEVIRQTMAVLSVEEQQTLAELLKKLGCATDASLQSQPQADTH